MEGIDILGKKIDYIIDDPTIRDLKACIQFIYFKKKINLFYFEIPLTGI